MTQQTWQEKALKEISEIIYDYNFHTDNSATKVIINWIEQNKEIIGQEENEKMINQVTVQIQQEATIEMLKPQSISQEERYSFNQIAPLIAALGEISNGKSASMSTFNKPLSESDMSIMAKVALEKFQEKRKQSQSIPQEGKGQEDKISKAIDFINNTVLNYKKQVGESYVEPYFFKELKNILNH